MPVAPAALVVAASVYPLGADTVTVDALAVSKSGATIHSSRSPSTVVVTPVAVVRLNVGPETPAVACVTRLTSMGVVPWPVTRVIVADNWLVEPLASAHVAGSLLATFRQTSNACPSTTEVLCVVPTCVHPRAVSDVPAIVIVAVGLSPDHAKNSRSPFAVPEGLVTVADPDVVRTAVVVTVKDMARPQPSMRGAICLNCRWSASVHSWRCSGRPGRSGRSARW